MLSFISYLDQACVISKQIRKTNLLLEQIWKGGGEGDKIKP